MLSSESSLFPDESLLGLPFDALQARLEADGLRPGLTSELWRFLHRRTAPLPGEWETLSAPLQRWWTHTLGDLPPELEPEIVDHLEGEEGRTHKLLLRLRDGQVIETVLMAYGTRHTLCLSSQAGCAMGCGFCATGQMGFSRHLSAGEIVAQVAVARRFLLERGQAAPRNLVFMGMGEPLDNYDAVMQALAVLRDDRGHGIGPSRVTISTVGVVPGILRMAEEDRPYNLAVSLHATDDAARTALVRANRRWPLPELLQACRDYQAATSRRILFGWTLIAGKNDSLEQAASIVELLQGLDAHVNLIRLNPTERFEGEKPGEEQARAFQALIRDAGLPCTLREHLGINVGAGCGQLKAERLKQRIHR